MHAGIPDVTSPTHGDHVMLGSCGRADHLSAQRAGRSGDQDARRHAYTLKALTRSNWAGASEGRPASFTRLVRSEQRRRPLGQFSACRSKSSRMAAVVRRLRFGKALRRTRRSPTSTTATVAVYVVGGDGDQTHRGGSLRRRVSPVTKKRPAARAVIFGSSVSEMIDGATPMRASVSANVLVFPATAMSPAPTRPSPPALTCPSIAAMTGRGNKILRSRSGSCRVRARRPGRTDHGPPPR